MDKNKIFNVNKVRWKVLLELEKFEKFSDLDVEGNGKDFIEWMSYAEYIFYKFYEILYK